MLFRFLLFTVLAGALAACSGPAASDRQPATAAPATPEVLPATLPTAEPWTAADLLPPAELARQLTGPGPAPVVFDMGPAGTIKGARPIGPAQEAESLTKLRAALAGLPKDQPVVVYCGCCPFEPCPNIRPAFQTLKDGGFTKAKLLNLPQNLKADWIDKGYPMAAD